MSFLAAVVVVVVVAAAAALSIRVTQLSRFEVLSQMAQKSIYLIHVLVW